jgi:hypothetical protein
VSGGVSAVAAAHGFVIAREAKQCFNAVPACRIRFDFTDPE